MQQILWPLQFIGEYHPPALRRGNRVMCLYRDAECVVTYWSDAPIPWPRVQIIGAKGGSGLLVNETLVQAIRTESSLAIQHWFGVGQRTVWCWRKCFGVSQVGTEGSKRLVKAAGKRGTDAIKLKEWTDEELDEKSQASKGRRIADRWAGRHWTAEMDIRLGTESDEVLAREWGKSATAVRVRRARLGIAKVDDNRKRPKRVTPRSS